MIKLNLVIFTTVLLTIYALEKDEVLRELKEEEPDFPLDERRIDLELTQFQKLDRTVQLLEIKRELMQSLGRVTDLYKGLGKDSMEVKAQILDILRKVQSAPEDQNEAKEVFKQVAENLNHLMKVIPEDMKTIHLHHHGNVYPERPVVPHRPSLPEGQPEGEWEQIAWRPPQSPHPPRPIAEWKPPLPIVEWRPPVPNSEWNRPEPKPEWNRPEPKPEWNRPESKPEYAGRPEWRPPAPAPEWRPPGPASEWRPPVPHPEWNDPLPIPEYDPHHPVWQGPVYPPVYPQPEGRLGYLVQSVLGIIRAIKGFVLCLA